MLLHCNVYMENYFIRLQIELCFLGQDRIRCNVQELLSDICSVCPLTSDKVENAHAGVRQVANKMTYARKVTDHTAEELSFLRTLKAEHHQVQAL